MYSKRTGLILGFHGCDKITVDRLLNTDEEFIESNNDYDWLGHGIYFWENSPTRALEFAEFLKAHPERNKKTSIKTPAVLGAVIDLGYCLDLVEFENLKLLKIAYEFLKESYVKSDLSIPQNKNIGCNNDLLLRKLDCAVIEILHKINELDKKRPFDSVRAVFIEWDELYPNAGFKEKNHIQICIRNPNCIKGVFLPRKIVEKFNNV